MSAPAPRDTRKFQFGHDFRRIRRLTFAKYKCLLIKYKNDTRYSGEKAATHDRCVAGFIRDTLNLVAMAGRLTFAANPCSKLGEMMVLSSEYDVVGIDEGQFFPGLFRRQFTHPAVFLQN